MNPNIFTIFYFLYLSFGRCCDLKRSTGFICLSFANIRVLATSMDNISEKNNQFEKTKEEETDLDDKNESPRWLLHLLACTMCSIFLLPIILILNWLFIGFSDYKITGTCISIYLIAITIMIWLEIKLL